MSSDALGVGILVADVGLLVLVAYLGLLWLLR